MRYLQGWKAIVGHLRRRGVQVRPAAIRRWARDRPEDPFPLASMDFGERHRVYAEAGAVDAWLERNLGPEGDGHVSVSSPGSMSDD